LGLARPLMRLFSRELFASLHGNYRVQQPGGESGCKDCRMLSSPHCTPDSPPPRLLNSEDMAACPVLLQQGSTHRTKETAQAPMAVKGLPQSRALVRLWLVHGAVHVKRRVQGNSGSDEWPSQDVRCGISNRSRIRCRHDMHALVLRVNSPHYGLSAKSQA
jgi:hypothetical protein